MNKIKTIAVVLILVIAVFAGIFIITRESKPPVKTTIIQEGEVSITSSGDAVVSLPTTITSPALADTYREAISIEGEEEYKNILNGSLEDEYIILLGLDLNITNTVFTDGDDGSFNIEIDGNIPQAAFYNFSRGNWMIDIKPQNKENGDHVEYMVTQTMFAQTLLNKYSGEQELDIVNKLPIKLPADATLLNGEELSSKTWRIDFGGGTYREAYLSISDDGRKVVMNERLVVKRGKPDLNSTVNRTYETAYDYREFSIDYNLPDGFLTYNPPLGDKVEECLDDWEFHRSKTISHTFRERFEDSTDSAEIDLRFNATPSFTFEFYIGWDFDWEWDIPPLQLDWFETYVKFTPAMYLEYYAYAYGSYDKTIGGEDYDYVRSWDIVVSIGVITIVIELRFEAIPEVDVFADVEFEMDGIVDAESTITLGVRYDNRWINLNDYDSSFIRHGPNINIGGNIGIEASTEFKFGAYLYGTVGPYASLTPFVYTDVEVGTTSNRWEIGIGFDFAVGVGFGSLGDWLPLDDHDIASYRWQDAITSGSWDSDNNPPSLEIVSTPPETGSVIDTYTFEVNYSDPDGDPAEYVRVRFGTKRVNMTYVSGDSINGSLYRLVWDPEYSDEGMNYYYFEAYDGQQTARLPESDNYGHIDLSLPWVEIYGGFWYTAGRSILGGLLAWGENSNYMFFDESVNDHQTTPRKVRLLRFNQIYAKYDLIGIYQDGSVGVYPYALDHQFIDSSYKFVDVAAGIQHYLGVSSDGKLYSWGYDQKGELGQGDVSYIASPNRVGTDSNWESVETSGETSYAIKSDGTLWAWGRNAFGLTGWEFGVLGNEDLSDQSRPTQVGTDSDWESVSASSDHALAIKTDGTLWAWGSNSRGEMGAGTDVRGSKTPIQIGTDTDWKQVVTHTDHSLALKDDNSLWAWGFNGFGQLGLGHTETRYNPVQVGKYKHWVGIGVGTSHSMAIKDDTTLWSWGLNDKGQLGQGDFVNRLFPTIVS